MLTLIAYTDSLPLDIDDYSINQKYSGMDELDFSVLIDSEYYPQLLEEAKIIEGSKGQTYLIKAIDGGGVSANIKCQLDMDAWCADMLQGYSNSSATVLQTIQQVIPKGWTVNDQAYFGIQRTVEIEDGTPLDVLEACRKPYSVTYRFDTKARTVTIIDPESYKPVGAFASKELNLKAINYKGKSSSFATRLYAYGKDGLSFASINDGIPYVDDLTYSDKIICAPVWRDDRYTDAENLLADTKKALAELAVPQRSYECDVVDLASTNPELYGFLNFGLFEVVTLIDDCKQLHINHQVVECTVYPHYPDRNVITLSTLPPSIQSSVKQVQEQITKPTSDFNQRLQAGFEASTQVITGALGGNYNLLLHPETKKPYGWAIMDTEDTTTAQDTLMCTAGGLGHSSHGINGPMDGIAITADGKINATQILTGELNAGLIRTGRIQSHDGKVYFDLDAKELTATKLIAPYMQSGTMEVALTEIDNDAAGFVLSIGGRPSLWVTPYPSGVEIYTVDGCFIYSSHGTLTVSGNLNVRGEIKAHKFTESSDV